MSAIAAPSSLEEEGVYEDDTAECESPQGAPATHLLRPAKESPDAAAAAGVSSKESSPGGRRGRAPAASGAPSSGAAAAGVGTSATNNYLSVSVSRSGGEEPSTRGTGSRPASASAGGNDTLLKVSSQSAWYTSRTVQMKDELQTVTKQLAATKRKIDSYRTTMGGRVALPENDYRVHQQTAIMEDRVLQCKVQLMRTNDRALQGRTDVEEQRTEILIARDVTVRLREDIAAVRSDTAAHVHATERAVEATAATNERCDADRTAANDLLNTFAEQLESLGDVGSGGAHTMSPARTFLSGRGHMDIIRERRMRSRIYQNRLAAAASTETLQAAMQKLQKFEDAFVYFRDEFNVHSIEEFAEEFSGVATENFTQMNALRELDAEAKALESELLGCREHGGRSVEDYEAVEAVRKRLVIEARERTKEATARVEVISREFARLKEQRAMCTKGVIELHTMLVGPPAAEDDTGAVNPTADLATVQNVVVRLQCDFAALQASLGRGGFKEGKDGCMVQMPRPEDESGSPSYSAAWTIGPDSRAFPPMMRIEAPQFDRPHMLSMEATREVGLNDHDGDEATKPLYHSDLRFVAALLDHTVISRRRAVARPASAGTDRSTAARGAGASGSPKPGTPRAKAARQRQSMTSLSSLRAMGPTPRVAGGVPPRPAGLPRVSSTPVTAHRH